MRGWQCFWTRRQWLECILLMQACCEVVSPIWPPFHWFLYKNLKRGIPFKTFWDEVVFNDLFVRFNKSIIHHVRLKKVTCKLSNIILLYLTIAQQIIMYNIRFTKKYIYISETCINFFIMIIQKMSFCQNHIYNLQPLGEMFHDISYYPWTTIE